MIIKRCEDNPILKPDKNNIWEMNAAFNCSPVKTKDGVALVYRAESSDYFHTYANRNMVLSSVGLAHSKDGIKFKKGKKFIFTANEWDKYGLEDPRITKLGNKYYIFYTALSKYPFEGSGIKVAVAISKDLKTIEKRKLVTPFNAKAMTMFPEKINGKIWTIFSFHTDMPPTKICLAPFDKESDLWNEKHWADWYKVHEKYVLNLKRSDKDHVEVGAQPVKTEKGWVIFYSYIKNYFTGNPTFGVEAVLLDLKDPTKIIGRTEGPLLVPEEYYEKMGNVANIVFPSGAMVVKDKVYLYYGAADTTCALAIIDLESLLDELTISKELRELKLKRYKKNPIITPNENLWEKRATFNPGAIYLDGKVHILYRAFSQDNTSTMGYATSKNGFKIKYRSDKPCYVPRAKFELKLKENGFSGCEDPRLTKIDDTIYMVYTAYDSIHNPRVALTNIKVDDFLNQDWSKWAMPELISPPNTDNKDACIFPEKINGKYYILHRNGTGIDLSKYDDLKFPEYEYLQETKWMSKRKGWWDSEKVGTAAPPIKTEKGWLVFYHGVSEGNVYSVGAFLLDLKNPFKVIARTGNPIFTPEMPYEREGDVNNVVFPCGVVQIKDTLYAYYGGGDKVVGVATIKLNDLLDKLEAHRVDE